MSARINLNDNIADRFEFRIGGLDYDFKYPTLDEIDPITKLTQEREAESKKDTPEAAAKVAELDEKLTDALYGLIVPVGHSVPIRDTLKTQPFPVIKAFNKMMTEQLSAE